MRVFDQLDFLTLVQGVATVEKYDASVDNVTTSGIDTDVLDLVKPSPNYLGQSLYVKPLNDVNGAGVAGTGSAMLVAELYDGATTSPVSLRATANQLDPKEELEIPLPQDVLRYIKIKVKSNGGGASNAVVSGAFMVYIGAAGHKE